MMHVSLEENREPISMIEIFYHHDSFKQGWISIRFDSLEIYIFYSLLFDL